MNIDAEDGVVTSRLENMEVAEVSSPAVAESAAENAIDSLDNFERQNNSAGRRASSANSEPIPDVASSDDDEQEAVDVSDSEFEIDIEPVDLNDERTSDGEDEEAVLDTTDSGDEPTAGGNEISFDTNLPAEHAYLGSNMNRVSGVQYLEVGKIHTILLFLHHHIVFPGDVTPFIVPEFIFEEDIDSENGLLFGVAFDHVRDPKTNAMYGVTCQIYEKGNDERGNLIIKTRALQRFVTTYYTKREYLESISSGMLLRSYGDVKILPEINLPDPLGSVNIGSMNRFRDIPSLAGFLNDFRATTTIWQKHVYNQYSINSTIEKVLKSLESNKLQSMPTDPTRLSFWLSRNAHISEEQLSKIFMTDCVNVRMRMIADSYSDGTVFVCRVCRNPIAHCKDLFAMSKYGVQSQYCNPSGYIHETNTVYKLFPNAVTFSGEPSSEFSWFPGYQWHIIVCKKCKRLIGWQFRANTDNLIPALFYGITGASVKVSKKTKRRPIMNNYFSDLLDVEDFNIVGLNPW